MSPETRETPTVKPEEIISETLKKQIIDAPNGNGKTPDIPESLAEYVRTENQTVYLTVERGLKKFHPTITFAPATDADWFALIKDVQQKVKGAGGDISFGFINPYSALGKKKQVSSTGFKNRIGDMEFANAMNAYFDSRAEPEAIEVSDEELLDYDEDVTITVRFLHNGSETTKHIYFKGEPSQEDLDEFAAADENKPSKQALASHAKKIRQERICELGAKYRTGSDYVNDDVPAWHLFTATLSYFYSEVGRMGKF